MPWIVTAPRAEAAHFLRSQGTIASANRLLRDQAGRQVVEIGRYRTKREADHYAGLATVWAAHGFGRLGKSATNHVSVGRS